MSTPDPDKPPLGDGLLTQFARYENRIDYRPIVREDLDDWVRDSLEHGETLMAQMLKHLYVIFDSPKPPPPPHECDQ